MESLSYKIRKKNQCDPNIATLCDLLLYVMGCLENNESIVDTLEKNKKIYGLISQ